MNQCVKVFTYFRVDLIIENGDFGGDIPLQDGNCAFFENMSEFTECFCRGPVERRRRIKMTGMEKVTYFIESRGTFSISRIPKQYQITW